VKSRDLRDYSIVHFAAHAVADDGAADRSAVFLAAGANGEDGLLQAREIGALALEGQIVVLSACQTAGGTVLGGEGVLSLARAFFQAGARTVVGTRWPIRDADAAALFEMFYRHLATGVTVSEALARTKADAIAEHRPAAAWAALVLWGEGSARLAPEPGNPPRRWGALDTIVVLVSVALIAALGLALARRARLSALE
jgi:CHAT domain-containing protein